MLTRRGLLKSLLGLVGLAAVGPVAEPLGKLAPAIEFTPRPPVNPGCLAPGTVVNIPPPNPTVISEYGHAVAFDDVVFDDIQAAREVIEQSIKGRLQAATDQATMDAFNRGEIPVDVYDPITDTFRPADSEDRFIVKGPPSHA